MVLPNAVGGACTNLSVCHIPVLLHTLQPRVVPTRWNIFSLIIQVEIAFTLRKRGDESLAKHAIYARRMERASAHHVDIAISFQLPIRRAPDVISYPPERTSGLSLARFNA